MTSLFNKVQQPIQTFKNFYPDFDKLIVRPFYTAKNSTNPRWNFDLNVSNSSDDELIDDPVVKMQEAFGRGEPGLQEGTKLRWEQHKYKI